MRSYVKAFARKTRFLPKTSSSQKNGLWLYVTFYNWCIPHTTLSKKWGSLCTPAMAAGLTHRVLSIEEWIKNPICKTINTKLEFYEQKINDPERIRAYKRSAYYKGHSISKEAMLEIECY